MTAARATRWASRRQMTMAPAAPAPVAKAPASGRNSAAMAVKARTPVTVASWAAPKAPCPSPSSATRASAESRTMGASTGSAGVSTRMEPWSSGECCSATDCSMGSPAAVVARQGRVICGAAHRSSISGATSARVEPAGTDKSTSRWKAPTWTRTVRRSTCVGAVEFLTAIIPPNDGVLVRASSPGRAQFPLQCCLCPQLGAWLGDRAAVATKPRTWGSHAGSV